MTFGQLGLIMGGGGGGAPAWTDLDIYASSNAMPGGDGSIGHPFSSLADIQSAMESIGHGVKVGFMPGSVFRGFLDARTLNDVTVMALPGGRMPEISAMEIEDTWVKTDGYTNIYETTWTRNLTEPINRPMVVEYDAWTSDLDNDGGTVMRRVADLATLDSTPGGMMAEATSGTTLGETAKCYIHASDSGDPNSNGKTYEVTRHLMALYLGDDCAVHGMHLRGSMWKDGILRMGRRATAERALCRHGLMHIVFAASWKRCKDAVVYQLDRNPALAGSAGNVFISYNGGPTNEDNTLNNIWVVNDEPQVGHALFFGHTGSTSGYRKTKITKAVGINIDSGLLQAQVEEFVADQVLLYNVGVGIVNASNNPIANYTNLEYHNDLSDTPYAQNFLARITPTPGTRLGNSIIIDNVIVRTRQSGISVPYEDGSMSIRNAELIQIDNTNNRVAIVVPAASGNGGSLTVEDALFRGWNNNGNLYGIQGMATVSGVTLNASNNLYVTDAGGDPRMKFRWDSSTIHANPTAWLADQQPSNEVGSATIDENQYDGDPTVRGTQIATGSLAAAMEVGTKNFKAIDISNLADLKAAWRAGYLGVDGTFPPE